MKAILTSEFYNNLKMKIFQVFVYDFINGYILFQRI